MFGSRITPASSGSHQSACKSLARTQQYVVSQQILQQSHKPAASTQATDGQSSSSSSTPAALHMKTKRSLLLGVSAAALSTLAPPTLSVSPLSTAAYAATTSTDAPPASIDLSLAPDQALYDPSDPKLREAAQLLQSALNAPSVQKEEALWTELINKFEGETANWSADVVGRAYGNRGNARSRQGKLNEALADYNKAIKLCKWSIDPVLNRGVVLESLNRFPEAIADYKAVLAVEPNDPAAWNNLGNATAGAGDWKSALPYYTKATRLAPQFAFAFANRACALYETGEKNESIKELRSLLRRYPDFNDARAALAAALWSDGLQAQAEEEYQRVDDARYKDPVWLKNDRRWPPKLVADLTAFLKIKDVK